MSSPTTATWPQTARPRGSGVRFSARTTTRKIAPRAIRASATWTGAHASSSTLMHRKLDPQIADRRTNCARHDCMGTERPPDAVREVISSAASGRGRGVHEELGKRLSATTLGVPLQPQREPAPGHLERFDHAVRRRRGDPQAAPDAADRLMVVAEDVAARAQRVASGRAARRRDGVWAVALMAVDVLTQRPAEEDAEQLRAATDANDGNVVA